MAWDGVCPWGGIYRVELRIRRTSWKSGVGYGLGPRFWCEGHGKGRNGEIGGTRKGLGARKSAWTYIVKQWRGDSAPLPTIDSAWNVCIL